MLKIVSRAFSEMVEHCQREYPNEACGSLAGRNGCITNVFPIRNDAQSPTFYEMNTGDQLKAQKEFRLESLEHLANYHSHVATEAYPSRRDIDRATEAQVLFDGYYIVVSLSPPGPRARAFKIQDGHVAEEELVET